MRLPQPRGRRHLGRGRPGGSEGIQTGRGTQSKGNDFKSLFCVKFVLIQVVSAIGLPKKGGMRSLIGQDKPDPYVKVSVGAEQFVTQRIKNCCDPVWEQEGW